MKRKSKLWIVENWRTRRDFRRFTFGLFTIFGALEIGIQLHDAAFPTWPLHFGACLVFYFCIVTPLAYLMRNNP